MRKNRRKEACKGRNKTITPAAWDWHAQGDHWTSWFQEDTDLVRKDRDRHLCAIFVQWPKNLPAKPDKKVQTGFGFMNCRLATIQINESTSHMQKNPHCRKQSIHESQYQIWRVRAPYQLGFCLVHGGDIKIHSGGASQCDGGQLSYLREQVPLQHRRTVRVLSLFLWIFIKIFWKPLQETLITCLRPSSLFTSPLTTLSHSLKRL